MLLPLRKNRYFLIRAMYDDTLFNFGQTVVLLFETTWCRRCDVRENRYGRQS